MKISYDFTKFAQTRVRLDDRISITSFRSFGFPSKFFNDNGLKKFKYVELFYDKGNKAIGFSFTNNEEEKHKFSLIKSKHGYGASVVATSFFKTYNLMPQKYRGKYRWTRKTIPNIGKLFIINLKEGERSLKRKQD